MRFTVLFIILMVWFPSVYSADLSTDDLKTEMSWTANGVVLLGVDRDDTTVVSPLSSKNGFLQTNSYNNEVSLGKAKGITRNYKFGIGTIGITLEAVWDGSNLTGVTDYNYITDDFANGSKLWISSSSANDDGTGTLGTGALSIEVYGLDTNWDEINETINLNGTATVETVNTYIRVYRAFVQKSGSVRYNSGHIYLHRSAISSGVPTDFTKLYAMITSARGQTLMSVYTVPRGYNMLVEHYSVGCGSGKQVESDASVRLFGTNTFRTRLGMIVYQNSREVPFRYPVLIPEKSDVEIHAKCDSSTVLVDATWYYILIPNE